MAADLPAGGADGWARYLPLCGVVAVLWSVPYVLRSRRMYADADAEQARSDLREREHLTQLSAARLRAAIAREFHDVVARKARPAARRRGASSSSSPRGA